MRRVMSPRCRECIDKSCNSCDEYNNGEHPPIQENYRYRVPEVNIRDYGPTIRCTDVALEHDIRYMQNRVAAGLEIPRDIFLGVRQQQQQQQQQRHQLNISRLMVD